MKLKKGAEVEDPNTKKGLTCLHTHSGTALEGDPEI